MLDNVTQSEVSASCETFPFPMSQFVCAVDRKALHNPHDVVADPICRHDPYARSGMTSTNSIGTPTNRSRPLRLRKVDP